MTTPLRLPPGRGRLDVIGAAVSCACACHCVALPLLLAAVPALGAGLAADERVEWLLVVLSAVIGLASLGRSAATGRRRLAPLLAFALGMGCLVAPRVAPRATERSEQLGALLGASLITSAHLRNRTLTRRCCECVE